MMKAIFTLLILLVFQSDLGAQNYSLNDLHSKGKNHNSAKTVNFNGQWKGGFDENSGGIPGMDDDIKYVLELNINGSQVSGYSYTYFTEGFKRYYTICRLTGTLNRGTNELIVTEIERTKFNTPPDFVNCFQTHRLHYERDSGNIEELRGTWIPAPNQGRGCGSGTTVLSRRVVNPRPIGFLPSHQHKSIAKASPKKLPYHKPSNNKPNNSVAKKSPKPEVQIPEKLARVTPKVEVVPPVENERNQTIAPSTNLSKGFTNRKTNILKTIDLEQPTFRLDFYDNGEIDGDSITVFYNGKVVLSNKRLSDKPISLTLTIDKNIKENKVTMYADNLGTIPPNTALMVVTDGGKRYEVRMESDYGKSGTVIFEHNQGGDKSE